MLSGLQLRGGVLVQETSSEDLSLIDNVLQKARRRHFPMPKTPEETDLLSGGASHRVVKEDARRSKAGKRGRRKNFPVNGTVGARDSRRQGEKKNTVREQSEDKEEDQEEEVEEEEEEEEKEEKKVERILKNRMAVEGTGEEELANSYRRKSKSGSHLHQVREFSS